MVSQPERRVAVTAATSSSRRRMSKRGIGSLLMPGSVPYRPVAMTLDQANRRAVILAGGKGTRLAPYTTVLPKPLMPIGDMPILEILLRQLSRAGVRNVTLSVGYLASLL